MSLVMRRRLVLAKMPGDSGTFADVAAWLAASGRFKICFRWGGRKLKKTIKSKSEKEADATLLRFQENIDLLERGRLELPPNADIGTFLLSDGKIAKKPQPESIAKPMTLDELQARYVEVHCNG
jgi:hypothetical protein